MKMFYFYKMYLKYTYLLQVKIWFQNRRVKYKKEELPAAVSGVVSPGKCCCLRTCSISRKPKASTSSNEDMDIDVMHTDDEHEHPH